MCIFEARMLTPCSNNLCLNHGLQWKFLTRRDRRLIILDSKAIQYGTSWMNIMRRSTNCSRNTLQIKMSKSMQRTLARTTLVKLSMWHS